MSYKRVVAPESFPTGDALTADMVGIGMLFAARGSKNPNIENTIVAASIEGMEKEDLRTLSLLVDWLNIHVERVNADRLIRLVSKLKSVRTKCFWAAIAQWLKKDRRLKKLEMIYKGPRVDLLSSGTDFLIKRSGEDTRFINTKLRVPEKTLRHRPEDILTPEELAKRHSVYRNRTIIGPTYRADMWAMIETEPDISVSELARRCYGSFATAWQVKHDWDILRKSA